MGFIAIRGGKRIECLNYFKAHLASLLKLENVGLLLGSGASVPAGGLTLAGLWEDFINRYSEYAQWLKNEGFIGSCHFCKETPPNIDELINSLEIAHAEWTRHQNKKLSELHHARNNLYKSILRAAVFDESMREGKWDKGSADALGFNENKLAHHKLVLQKLLSTRQPGQAAPWVFTTNYDLAIEWAADSIGLHVLNGFIGLHRRVFSPQSFDLGFRNTQARGEARFGSYNIYLAKLHGSLTWSESDDEILEMQDLLAWEKITGFLTDEHANEDFGFLVMPRAAKYMETIGFVLGELFRRFSEFISKPQTVLIVNGYGFGDRHINRLLLSGTLNPTLQLVIYYPEFSEEDNKEKLPRTLNKLVESENPRVTVIGGGNEAYIDSLAEHLPDPLLYDENTQKYRKLLKDE